MADTSWGLAPDVLMDVSKTFVGPAAIYRRLQTSNKIWEPKFVARTGVKHGTANKIATLFLGVLRDVNRETPNVDGIHLGMARHLYETKYADRILSGLDTANMIEKLVSELASIDDAPGLASVTPIHAQAEATARAASRKL